MSLSKENLVGSLEELEGWVAGWLDMFMGRDRTIVTIEGDMGVGKTTFCQALLRRMGYTREVTSPTFALHHRYLTAFGCVDHFDLYRVEATDWDFWIFFEEILEKANWGFVEWPERYPFLYPDGTVEVKIEVIECGLRRYCWGLR